MDWLEKIAQDAFEDEIEKIALSRGTYKSTIKKARQSLSNMLMEHGGARELTPIKPGLLKKTLRNQASKELGLRKFFKNMYAGK